MLTNEQEELIKKKIQDRQKKKQEVKKNSRNGISAEVFG